MLDTFRDNLNEDAKNEIIQNHSDLLIIPGGITSQL